MMVRTERRENEIQSVLVVPLHNAHATYLNFKFDTKKRNSNQIIGFSVCNFVVTRKSTQIEICCIESEL